MRKNGAYATSNLTQVFLLRVREVLRTIVGYPASIKIWIKIINRKAQLISNAAKVGAEEISEKSLVIRELSIN